MFSPLIATMNALKDFTLQVGTPYIYPFLLGIFEFLLHLLLKKIIQKQNIIPLTMNQEKYILNWHTYSDHLRKMLHDMMKSNELTGGLSLVRIDFKSICGKS